MKEAPIVALLEVGLRAAQASTKLLVKMHQKIFGDQGPGELPFHTKSSDIDFVTEADSSAQAVIIERIQDQYPDHRFIAEEEGADRLGSPSSPYEWIIDPLDGTNNFIHGKKNFGTIIAVQREGELLVGVMILPLLNLTFTAAKGAGAFVNGRPTRLRQTRSMTEAILSSNTIRRAKKDTQGVLQISTPYCSSLENCGCAALEIGEIILGQNDGAFFRGIKLWDIAAGCLMVQEAGGKYRYERLEPDNPRSGLLAAISTAPIYKELSAFVFEKNLT